FRLRRPREQRGHDRSGGKSRSMRHVGEHVWNLLDGWTPYADLRLIRGIVIILGLSFSCCRSGTMRIAIFKDDRATQTIYTPLPAFARRARDTVMRRANRRVGEMGDDEHEKAQA